MGKGLSKSRWSDRTCEVSVTWISGLVANTLLHLSQKYRCKGDLVTWESEPLSVGGSRAVNRTEPVKSVSQGPDCWQEERWPCSYLHPAASRLACQGSLSGKLTVLSALVGWPLLSQMSYWGLGEGFGPSIWGNRIYISTRYMA